MSGRGKKVLLITSEIIALVILTISFYWGAIKLIFTFGDGRFPLIFLILVVVSDVLYLVTMKFWPLKKIYIKIVVALLLFACSAAIATIYMMPLNFGF